MAPSYTELKFGRNSCWAEFLKTYTEKTRRPARNVEADAEVPASVPASGSFFNQQKFRKTQDRGQTNPVHSMRNPPLVWAPEDIIDPQEDIRRGLRRLAKEGQELQPVAVAACPDDKEVKDGKLLRLPTKRKPVGKPGRVPA